MDPENPGLLLKAALPLVLTLAACQRESPRMRAFPRYVLWAWESPQDLRFLRREVGVAFLAGELHLEGGATWWQPRRNSLRVGPWTPLLAVIRLEAHDSALTESQRRDLVLRARQCLAQPQVMGLQIDFDARLSERAWYMQALQDLRAALPEETPISITALGSWCWDDPWISGLPIDEAVPMLFRMSSDDGAIRRRLSLGRDVTVDLARHSWGISTDEPLPVLKSGRRIYVFHPGPWTAEAWEKVWRTLP